MATGIHVAGEVADAAIAPQSVTLTLADDIDAARGAVIAASGTVPTGTRIVRSAPLAPYWSIFQAACMVSSRAALSSAADSAMRRRAVPSGTVGGRIAGTQRPRVCRPSITAKASSLGPMTRACTAVLDSPSCHGVPRRLDSRPSRRRAIRWFK